MRHTHTRARARTHMQELLVAGTASRAMLRASGHDSLWTPLYDWVAGRLASAGGKKGVTTKQDPQGQGSGGDQVKPAAAKSAKAPRAARSAK